MAGTLKFLERTAHRYGPLSYFRLLHQQIYLVDDAELIKEVLVVRQHDFSRDTGATLLRELVGDGLLTRDEPLHRERRRTLQPAFHREQIEAYAAIMIRECERATQKWIPQGTFDLGREMRRLTLSIVGASLFGAEFQENAGGVASAESIAQILRRVMRKSARIAPFLSLLQPFAKAYRKRAPNGPSLFFRKERRKLDAILKPIIEGRRISPARDVISLLLDGGELSGEDVRNEVVTFVLAGHETTATALTWACYLIAAHPLVRERLEAEIDAVLANGPLTFESCGQLRFTTMVFQEAMRLYPPAPAFGRKAVRDVKLNGYVVPRGSSVFVSPYVTHRNERYFDEPHEFRPERWENPQVPKFAYFPFGGGAKMCIGEPFAKMEGIIALATIARHMRLEIHQGSEQTREPGFGPGITLQPDRPIEVKALARPAPAISTPRPSAN